LCRKDSQEFQVAHFVLRSAQDESASWANQEDGAQAAQRRTAKYPGDQSADAWKPIGWCAIATPARIYLCVS
jgi:hypothetical protein